MATFGIHFDGSITVEHKVSIRVLSKTYEHMQRAIDRAYLIEVHGEVWKHARLTDRQYSETEFIAAYPREGGIILDAVRHGADAIIDRIAGAVAPFYEESINQGVQEFEGIAQQHNQRLATARAQGANLKNYDLMIANAPRNWSEGYSNKSIVKEIDQLVNQISPQRVNDSTVDLNLHGSIAHPLFEFNEQRAKRFHRILSRRELGPVVRAHVTIRSLDRGNRYTNPNAKVLNLSTNREVTLRLDSILDCDTLRQHHNGEPVEIFVCPIIESLGFDVHGGDLMFIDIARQ